MIRCLAFERTFYLCYFSWQELQYLFQTFGDLEQIKDEQTDIKAVRQLLHEAEDGEGGVC